MRLVVRQISGLGNQLFQYAAGMYYAEAYGATMRVALDPERRRYSQGSPRPVLLSHFNISAQISEAGWLDALCLTERRSLQPLARTLRTVASVTVLREAISDRYRLMACPPMVSGPRTLYLVGYWQTYRMAQAVEGKLRKELSFRKPPIGHNAEMIDTVLAAEQSVSLHIRRGDYTSAAEGNIALPMDYYERAITAMRERLPKAKFFVFSDDMAFARANLPQGFPAVFVDHNDDYTSHEDLRLMSNCRHHIIANSSFSWWGAWLNPHEDKMVIAPRQWLLKPDSVFPELTPPGWQLFDVI